MNITTTRARSVLVNDRLDAHFFTSPGVAASERVAILEASGIETVQVGDIANVWDPPRFARAWAAPAEPGVPYLRPYDVFDYLPTATDRLSLARNAGVEQLRPNVGTLLQTCSGRNLGPCAYADEHLAQFALSHDMIRIEISDPELRAYILLYLKTPTGQALLRRGKSGSVIDHLTTADVATISVPLLPAEHRRHLAKQTQQGLAAITEARRQLATLLASEQQALPLPTRSNRMQDGWTLTSSQVRDRLDAAYYDPLVAAAKAQVARAGGNRCGDLAVASLPVRYKRYYVAANHGRPIVSGRQLLQLEPVNLRYVSDRSFREPENYVIHSGMTVFGAVGRAEGRQGAAALVTIDRSGWMASNDVMRLAPRDGVLPGALWLAIAVQQSRGQINALSFGSVIDHMNPGDVEEILLPPVEDAAARAAEEAWHLFAEGGQAIREAVAELESQLFALSSQPRLTVA